MPFNKYYKQKKEVSYEGQTWQDVTPPEYQKGALYEVGSPDCQPTGTKLIAGYYYGDVYTKNCNGSDKLSSGETRPSNYIYTAMTEAVVGECVRSIGESGFSLCDCLECVYLPKSLVDIYSWSFYHCSSLTNIIIPDSVSYIGNFAFSDCTSLTSINIPSSLTSIGKFIFSDCYNLRMVNSNVDGECKIPARITNIGNGAFGGCGFTKITIEDGVNSIGESAFAGCLNATGLTLPNSIGTIGITAFQSCWSLTSLEIPNSVTSIGSHSFHNCSGLTSVIIGNGVTSISDGVFEDCTSLTGVTINATTPPTLGNTAFTNSNNCPIYVPASSVDAYKAASGWSTYASRIQAIP